MFWKAVIQQQTQPWDRTTRLQVFRRYDDGRVDVLLADGLLQTVEEGTAVPENAGLILPDEALEAIAEAFHPYATKTAGLEAKVEVLTRMLAIEHGRVDLVIGKVLGE